MTDINLLPEQNILSNREKNIHKYLIISVAVLTTLILVTQITLFFSSSYLRSQLDTALKKQSEFVAFLSANEKTAVDLRTIKAKVLGIKEVEKMQTDYGKIIGDVLSLIETDADIKSISLDTTGKVSVLLSSSSLGKYGNLVDKFTASQSSTMPFKAVSLLNTSVREGSFDYSLEMKYAAKN